MMHLLIVRLDYYLHRKNDVIRYVVHHLSVDLVIDVIALDSNIATVQNSNKTETIKFQFVFLLRTFQQQQQLPINLNCPVLFHIPMRVMMQLTIDVHHLDNLISV